MLKPLNLSHPPRLNRKIIADVILAALLSGPIIAPWFAYLNVFPFNIVAKIIYFMGGVVCPQPEMGLMIAPAQNMAVCMRCYGLLLALLGLRLIYGIQNGSGWYWLAQYRFKGAAIATVLTSAYLIEMLIELARWWEYNNYIVTAFGAVTGLGIGLFMVPVIYRQTE